MGDRFIRVDGDFSWHPKTLELERILNHPGAGGFVINIWCWATQNRPSGELAGLGAKEIADIARWPGDPDAFLSALRECGGAKAGFIEGDDGHLVLHDWEEKQIFFVGAERRQVERSRKAKTREKQAEADSRQDNPGTLSRRCPTQARDKSGTLSQECPTPEKSREDQTRSDPPPPTPPGGSGGFERFWKAYPKKIGKKSAVTIWQRIHPDSDLVAQMLTALESHKQTTQWTKESGRFIPHPTTWLRQERWQDELVQEPQSESGNLSRFSDLEEVSDNGPDQN